MHVFAEGNQDMIILALRTDNLIAELRLYDNETLIAEIAWEAHRQLTDTIHTKLDELLRSQSFSFHDIKGILVFKGPGSFTGLRIGISVANALAYGLNIPIVAQEGEDWLEEGNKRLALGENDKIAIPNYGADAHITLPKK